MSVILISLIERGWDVGTACQCSCGWHIVLFLFLFLQRPRLKLATGIFKLSSLIYPPIEVNRTSSSIQKMT